MRFVRQVRLGRLITSAAELPAITSVIRSTNSVAYDLETCDQRMVDRLVPWAGDIRLLSLRVQGQDSACAWLRSGCAEERFLMLCKRVKEPELEREYRFNHERRWQADFAQ